MLNNVDLLLLGILVIATFQGWRNGFIKALIVPFSFFLGIFMGILSLDISGNIIKSFFAFSISTIAISFILNLALYMGRRGVDPGHRNYVAPISRILGIGINCLWQSFLIIIFFSIILSLPEKMPHMKQIQAEIKKSEKAELLYSLIVSYVPDIRAGQRTINFLTDEMNYETLTTAPEFMNFAASTSAHNLLQDTEAIALLDKKDYWGFVRHPKVQALIQDDSAMHNFSKLIIRIYQSQRE